MNLIPVLDLMAGEVVRGVAGRRETYAPIQSELADSPSPSVVARAFRRELGLNQFYLADLDALMDGSPQWDVLSGLAAEGCELLVDAGLRDATEAEHLLDAGARRIVAALETLPGPTSLSEMLAAAGTERLVFSLDLMSGNPLGELAAWETSDPITIARRAIEMGITSLIILDLSSVGVGSGVPTHELCRQLRSEYPDVTLISGGGVRNLSDLIGLQQTGVDAALVASALHNRQIGREEIDAVRGEIDGERLAPL